MQRCIYLEALLTTMLLPQQQSLYTIIYTATQPIHAATLRTINYQPWMLLYLYNHASAATPTTKCLPLQLHTATLQPCCYPNNQVFTLTTTYCYPTTMLLPQQPSPYPYNYILLPYNHALPQLTLTTTYCYPTTMLLPQEPSLPLQLHTATLQPCCYPNNLVPTLTTTYCYPATMLLPQQPSPYPYNYILLPCNHAATPTT